MSVDHLQALPCMSSTSVWSSKSFVRQPVVFVRAYASVFGVFYNRVCVVRKVLVQAAATLSIHSMVVVVVGVNSPAVSESIDG